MSTVEDNSAVAFKEWAVVCAALASGRQTIILRKGGIHEGKEGFTVDHDGFWLFPTAFHQDPASLTPDAPLLLAETLTARPAEGTIRLRHFAQVQEVVQFQSLQQAMKLQGHHIWSERTVAQRFEYRQPGLFMILVRVHEAPQAVDLPDSAYFVGCRSWVDLPQAISTANLRPVMNDNDFGRQSEEVRHALQR